MSTRDVHKLAIPGLMLGEVTDKHEFVFGDEVVTLEEAIDTWKKPLEKVFPTRSEGDQSIVDTTRHYIKGNIYVCKNKVAKPNVFIPVFPGTNCEYDSAKAFERAGANVITKVFKNLDAQGIRDSVEDFCKKRSKNPRSSCSQVDSVPVMNQMDLQNSLQQHLEMKN